MTAGRICVRTVDTADAGESVQAAADRMNSRNVGTLLVLDSGRRPLGIVTDRDLTVRVLAKGGDPFRTSVADVMTRFPRTIAEETSINDAIAAMRSGPYRRLPVVNSDGQLVGLLSVDDILDLLAEEFREIGALLKKERPEVLAQTESGRFE